MKTASRALAEFVTSLEYSDIPSAVVEKAKACIIDTIAVSTYGAQLPWSRTIIDYCRRNSAAGDAAILGTDIKLRAPSAALANGAIDIANFVNLAHVVGEAGTSSPHSSRASKRCTAWPTPRRNRARRKAFTRRGSSVCSAVR